MHLAVNTVRFSTNASRRKYCPVFHSCIPLLILSGLRVSHLRGESPQQRLTLVRGEVELFEALPVALRSRSTRFEGNIRALVDVKGMVRIERERG